MKHILSTLLLAFATLTTWAQDCSIPMAVYVTGDKLTEESAETIQNQLSAAITTDGIEGGAYSLFSLVAKVSSVREDIISGIRPQYLKVLSVNLSVVNDKTGEKFGSTNVTLKGAGATAERAYTSAFTKLGDDSKVATLLNSSKSKIIAYYESQINSIMAESKRFATLKQYEAALSLLAAVPTCCNSYAKVENELGNVFQEYINYDCAEKIMRARAIWAASQTERSARTAGAYLSAISPSATCSDEAVELMSQIQSRMGEEWDLKKELTRGTMSQESERIEAARAVGIAYGQNQKAQTHNDHWIVR